MAHTVSDVMTAKPVVLDASDSVLDAARAMREHGIGDVVVAQDKHVVGILTDRDIAIRVVAEGKSTDLPLGECCTRDIAMVSPNASLDDALTIMSDQAVRRLPVVSENGLEGIVTFGDIVRERHPDSPLAAIIGAPGGD